MKQTSNQTNLRNAIVDLAKSMESVFKKYSRQTRTKAWEKLTSKEGEKEVKKIINDPARPINTFQKLATQKESDLHGVRVWLDDVRSMPVGFDVWARTADEAIDLIKKGNVSLISLDHDLGDDGLTGYDVAKFIEQSAFESELSPMEMRVHSANPVGAKNIRICLENAMRFWGQISTTPGNL